MKANEPKYARNLIEATLDPLITIDKNGVITDVNKAMEKATDKKRENLIGRHADRGGYYIEDPNFKSWIIAWKNEA